MSLDFFKAHNVGFLEESKLTYQFQEEKSKGQDNTLILSQVVTRWTQITMGRPKKTSSIATLCYKIHFQDNQSIHRQYSQQQIRFSHLPQDLHQWTDMFLFHSSTLSFIASILFPKKGVVFSYKLLSVIQKQSLFAGSEAPILEGGQIAVSRSSWRSGLQSNFQQRTYSC